MTAALLFHFVRLFLAIPAARSATPQAAEEREAVAHARCAYREHDERERGDETGNGAEHDSVIIERSKVPCIPKNPRARSVAPLPPGEPETSALMPTTLRSSGSGDGNRSQGLPLCASWYD